LSDVTLGGVIAAKRKELGLSQKELATKIRREDEEAISAQYLNDIERDRRSPSSDHMISQFASVLGLDADFLHYLNGRFPRFSVNARIGLIRGNRSKISHLALNLSR
jgi:transcriptional regulator with XRE-family HTH domain